MGAGVAVGPDRVLTAHYLVLGATNVDVAGADGKSRAVSRVSLDHETGLALLFLEGLGLKPATLASARTVTPGQPVFLLTCTNDHERKGATGHVSVVGPFEAFWEYMLDRAIMTTVINPGLAGAPLFDAGARLIGVVSLGLASPGRYSLAIPLDLYLERRAELESGQRASGHTPRAWVGFYPQGLDGTVVVTGVVPRGPADSAGLERGDVVLSVDGEAVSNLRELYLALWRRGPGDKIGLQVLRNSSIRLAEITAGDRDEFYR
jgi:S1-C subfamily serine protease